MKTVSGIPFSAVIERLSRLMRAAEHEQGLNPAQWQCLRYLDRANRFSNSPSALAKYLGATKGTVSQSLIALERKGLIRKEGRLEERRSIALTLTSKGRELLKRDPWLTIAAEAAAFEPRAINSLARGLANLLKAAIRRGDFPTFGQCQTCRHFARNASGKHRCLLLDLTLSHSDSLKICVEHEPPYAARGEGPDARTSAST